jgi:hypothetical protein
MIKRQSNIDILKQQFPIPNFDECDIAHWELLNQYSIKSIIENGGQLPPLPPFEKHPYIETLNPSDSATGLMIGTFPPITYLCDIINKQQLTFQGKSSKGLKQPSVSYFHGNLGTLWDHAPFNFAEIISNPNREIKKKLIIEELQKYKVLYTDIIQYCQRQLGKTEKGKLRYTANDTDLFNIVPNTNILDFIFNSNSINRIYFTNSLLFGMSKDFFNKNGQYSLKKNDAFQLFLKSAQINMFKIEVNIPNTSNGWFSINEDVNMTRKNRLKLNNLLSTKAIVKIRLTQNNISKEFNVVSSVSPAATSSGRTTSQRNLCVINYAKFNKCEIQESAALLLKSTLKAFFENDTDSLINYNYQQN